MPNYQNSKVYAIRSPHTDNIYIGSTTQSLSKRFYEHKKGHRRYQAGNGRYMTSFDILGVGDSYIELIQNYPCADKNELHRREGQYIRATKNRVNKHVAGRTNAEYREDNRERLQDQNKQYYQDNKQRLLAKQRQYRVDNLDEIRRKGKLYSRRNAKRGAVRASKWYYGNQDRIKQTFECDCGSTVRISGKARHKKTGRHKKYEDFMSLKPEQLVPWLLKLK